MPKVLEVLVALPVLGDNLHRPDLARVLSPAAVHLAVGERMRTRLISTRVGRGKEGGVRGRAEGGWGLAGRAARG